MKRFIHKTNSDHQTTMDIGLLYPIQFLDVLAGQTTWLNTSALVRFQPLLAPAFVKMNLHIVHFYVPYRLLWDKWLDFISGQAQFEIPTARVTQMNQAADSFDKTLLDYFGFPIEYGGSGSAEINFGFFPFLAYHKIWNEHFREPNIQQEVDIDAFFQTLQGGFGLGNAEMRKKFVEIFGLRRVNWGRDRFTTALLETETDPSINLPISSVGAFEFTTGSDPRRTTLAVEPGQEYPKVYSQTNSVLANQPLKYAAGLSGVSMSDFKLASAIYNFQINQNKFGRDVEAYFKKYGLRNMDLRLQRSEVIGGFAETMQISDIIATDGQDLGKQGGHAVGYAKKRAFKHYAPEHGLIMTMAYLRPKANYNGGIPRYFLKRDMLDFFQKEFANIGYQPIYQAELGLSRSGSIPVSEDDMPIFAYEPRYNEYRNELSKVTGELRPGKPLAHWSNPRVWVNNSPNLNGVFLECNPSNQIWASANTDKAIAYFKCNVSKKCFVPPYAHPNINL